MKQSIKCYHLFLSPSWLQKLIYLVYPVLLIMLTCLIAVATKFMSDIPYICSLIIGELLISAELFLDYFTFGGIASKDANRLDFFKTSANGTTALKNALHMDVLRRLSSIAVCMTAVFIRFFPAFNAHNLILLIVIPFLFTELGLLILRHFTQLSLLALILCIIGLIEPTIMGLCLYGLPHLGQSLPGSGILITAAICIISILLPVAGRKLIMKKVRDSYYDVKPEKSI